MPRVTGLLRGHILNRLPGGAEWARFRSPEFVRLPEDGHQRQVFLDEEVCPEIAQNEERAGDNGHRTLSTQRAIGASQGRACAHHVIQQRHAAAAQAEPIRRWKCVAHAVQSLCLRWLPLGEAELLFECVGHKLGEEGATEEWTAHDVNGVCSQLGGESRGERRDCSRVREQRVEIEPKSWIIPPREVA